MVKIFLYIPDYTENEIMRRKLLKTTKMFSKVRLLDNVKSENKLYGLAMDDSFIVFKILMFFLPPIFFFFFFFQTLKIYPNEVN